jgi:hypothetical protein
METRAVGQDHSRGNISIRWNELMSMHGMKSLGWLEVPPGDLESIGRRRISQAARDDSVGERSLVYFGVTYLFWWLRNIQAA